jgi:hypothetical protein
MDLFKNGEKVCRSDAIYGAGGTSNKEVDGKKWETITSYGECNGPIQIKFGDKLKIVARYDFTQRPQ